MKETKQDRDTRNIELVETGNIAKSIKRIMGSPGWNTTAKWKRSLHHALLIAGVDMTTVGKIRGALEIE